MIHGIGWAIRYEAEPLVCLLIAVVPSIRTRAEVRKRADALVARATRLYCKFMLSEYFARKHTCGEAASNEKNQF